MAVLISTKVKGQTVQGYDDILAAVCESIKQSPGFVLHCAHQGEGEWRVYEIWKSKQEADRWFAATIVPSLPAGIHPKRQYHQLHSLVTPG